MYSKGLEVFLKGGGIKECLAYVFDKVEKDPSMIEDELYRVLEGSGLFKKLGYRGIGIDIRPQRPIPGERKKPDYACRDEYQNNIFVIEVKRPSDIELKEALPQLWERYVLPLKSKYGVLTNGRQIVIYERVRVNHKLIAKIDLARVTEAECDLIFRTLKKPQYNIENIQEVRNFLFTVESVSLKTELAKENFFEILRLEETSIFGSLVSNLMKLFDLAYPRSKFLKGAHGFWRSSLARKPEKVPDAWKPFLKEDQNILKLMFCLETAHAMLARLMLAKACEDLKFPELSISNFVSQKIHHFRGQIPMIAYPIVLLRLLKEMRDQLVNSIFEEDIFSWWEDPFTELSEKSSKELLEEKPDVALDDFSESVARLILVLYRFDFSEVAGDPLGDLYQQYFDKDTRKALGEFYTPIEVVNYILDAVDYKPGRFLTNKRLLDPACGSGTFLVETLKRYLAEAAPMAKERGWASILRELCLNPRMVGLDIHPFACLIAQVRLMLELIPKYKKALEEEKAIRYTLPRIPVFRTDSLQIEISPQQKETPALAIRGKDIRFTATLPIRANTEKSVQVDIIIPSWERIRTEVGEINNLDEYLCAVQAWFDIVKERIRAKAEEVSTQILKTHFMNYLKDKDFQALASFFKPYGDRMLNEMKRLQSAFGDGRLVKSIEDAALAALLKNYLKYDFVVGNPPYIRVQMLPAELKNRLKQSYKTVVGKFDIYIPFLERGISWLNDDGKIGYINPNLFIYRAYGKKLRKFIIENCEIQQIVDFGDSGVFKDVTNYPCIVILKRHVQMRGKNVFKFISVTNPKEALLLDIKKRLAEPFYQNECFTLFEIDQSILDSDSWKMVPRQVMNILEKININAQTKLADIAAEIYEGFITGANNIFFVERNKAEQLKLEKELLREIPKGKDIKRWRFVTRERYVIYPHKSINGKTVPFSSFELKSKYPNVWKYFETYSAKLKKRKYLMDAIKKGQRQEWFEIWNPRNVSWFEQQKIITPNLSTENNFALDDGGYFLDHDCYGIILKNKDKANYLFVLALLNSKVLEFYLKQISPFASGRYFRYMTGYLNQLPIKLPQTSEEKRFVDQIIKRVELILQRSAPERLIRGFPDTYLSEYRSKGVEFDEIKCTFNANHSKLEPLLSGTVVKGYAVYPAKGEDPIWVETEEKARYLMLALKGKSVKQDETVKIPIPRDNSIVVNILDKLQTTMREIESIKADQLEKEIDELVYQLYGLNNQDIEVIESFLSKS